MLLISSSLVSSSFPHLLPSSPCAAALLSSPTACSCTPPQETMASFKINPLKRNLTTGSLSAAPSRPPSFLLQLFHQCGSTRTVALRRRRRGAFPTKRHLRAASKRLRLDCLHIWTLPGWRQGLPAPPRLPGTREAIISAAHPAHAGNFLHPSRRSCWRATGPLSKQQSPTLR